MNYLLQQIQHSTQYSTKYSKTVHNIYPYIIRPILGIFRAKNRRKVQKLWAWLFYCIFYNTVSCRIYRNVKNPFNISSFLTWCCWGVRSTGILCGIGLVTTYQPTLRNVPQERRPKMEPVLRSKRMNVLEGKITACWDIRLCRAASEPASFIFKV
jgi:hypothetical protein